jgi:hypothetical protein
MLIRNANHSRAISKRRSIVAVAVLGLAAVAGIGTAVGAGSRPAIQLVGTGTFQLADDGTVTLRGTATGRSVTGPYTGTLTANDGTLPDPGQCEPATATLRVDGRRRRFVELTAHGDVCGQWTDAVHRVTHVFTGRYDVTSSFPPRIHGTDGFYEVRVTDDEISSVFAIDT